MSQHNTRNSPALRKEDFVYDMDSHLPRRLEQKPHPQGHLHAHSDEEQELSHCRGIDVMDEEELTPNQIGKKKSWTPEEDNMLVELIEKYGPQKWTFIAEHLVGRIGKQCRERWHNHLNPNIKKDQWEDREEWLLYLSHRLLGNRWADISKYIVGRTDNSIKNHWNSSMKKKMPEFYDKYKGIKRNPALVTRLSVLEKELFEGLIKAEGNLAEAQDSSSKDRRRGFQPTHHSRPHKSTPPPVLCNTPPEAQHDSLPVLSVICVPTPSKAQQQTTERTECAENSLQVAEVRRKKVRVLDPERTTTKKNSERFDFTVTPKKDTSYLHNFIYSPYPSQFLAASCEKPHPMLSTSSEWREFNSPSVLLNLRSPSKVAGTFSSIVLFQADNTDE